MLPANSKEIVLLYNIGALHPFSVTMQSLYYNYIITTKHHKKEKINLFQEDHVRNYFSKMNFIVLKNEF